MNKQSDKTSKEIAIAGTCATIGAGAAIAVATAVSSPISLPIILIGATVGCLGGAILSNSKRKK